MEICKVYILCIKSWNKLERFWYAHFINGKIQVVTFMNAMHFKTRERDISIVRQSHVTLKIFHSLWMHLYTGCMLFLIFSYSCKLNARWKSRRCSMWVSWNRRFLFSFLCHSKDIIGLQSDRRSSKRQSLFEISDIWVCL